MNLKIFKLRSGEEIICQVKEETKTKYKILDPLVFKSTTSFDSHGSYDMTVLRDWLQHTKVKTIALPKNHIALEMDPTDDTVKLYTLQLDTERTINEKIVSIESEKEISKQIENTDDLFNEFLGSFLEDMTQALQPQNIEPPFANRQAPSKKWNKKNNTPKLPSPEMNPNELDRHGIYVTMMIPSESIMNLITSGLLNPKDLLKMIKEVKKKNRFTGDEVDRQDFGNKLSDWNPDPDSNDYK
jgi:hypothetical protein